MRIVVINGMPRSGKDTFVGMCQEIIGEKRCLNVSTVDFVKEVAAYCGWDKTKTPQNRAFLSDLKDLLTQWNDIPYKDIENRIKIFKRQLFFNSIPEEKAVVFIHCREPEEIDKFARRMKAITLLVRRVQVEDAEQSNHADKNVFEYEYDAVANNNGSLEDLKETAKEFLNFIFQ